MEVPFSSQSNQSKYFSQELNFCRSATMAAALSLCYSLTPNLPHNQTPTALSLSRANLSFVSQSLSSLTLTASKHHALSVTVKSTDTEAAVSVSEPEIEIPVAEVEQAVETAEPKREEVFAVVMVSVHVRALIFLKL